MGEGEEREEGERKRKSRDKKRSGEGRKLLQAIEERGWLIVNGCIKGDEKGEYTYTGRRGETVIDCVLDREVMERIERLDIGKKVDSGHHPSVVWLKGKVRRERGKVTGGKKIYRGRLDEEGRAKFEKEMERIQGVKGETEGEIRKIKERIKRPWKRRRKGGEKGR